MIWALVIIGITVVAVGLPECYFYVQHRKIRKYRLRDDLHEF